MQSGKILPIVRHFFASSVQSSGQQKHSNSGQQQDQGKNHREPSAQEFQAALELLNSQDELKKLGFTAYIIQVEGKASLVVKNAGGLVVRQMKNPDVHRILSLAGIATDSNQLGRLLDRRI